MNVKLIDAAAPVALCLCCRLSSSSANRLKRGRRVNVQASFSVARIDT